MATYRSRDKKLYDNIAKIQNALDDITGTSSLAEMLADDKSLIHSEEVNNIEDIIIGINPELFEGESPLSRLTRLYYNTYICFCK